MCITFIKRHERVLFYRQNAFQRHLLILLFFHFYYLYLLLSLFYVFVWLQIISSLLVKKFLQILVG